MIRTIEVAPPETRTPEEERTHRKQRLVAAFRLFARFGLIEGSAGHISARDPEQTGCYWINPVEIHWSHIRVSDLLRVDECGNVMEGAGRVNPAGVAIHGRILASLPHVTSVAHSHSPFGKAWSAHRRLLEPLTQDACAFYGDHDVVPFSGVVLDDSEGEHIAQVLHGKKSVILQNHGLLTVGGSVEEAAWWFISMERQCQVQLLAESAGRPRPIDPETATRTAQIQGAPATALSNFQPLWDLIRDQEPDLLD